jgi:hypothetical protein
MLFLMVVLSESSMQNTKHQLPLPAWSHCITRAANMQVHHSRNLQCQVLVSDALLETSKQTEQNLQEYDGPQRKATVSICLLCLYICAALLFIILRA